MLNLRAALLALALTLQPALAQEPAPPPAAPTLAGATRADLAQLYLRFERAFRDHPPAPERITEVNRVFDQASLQFFGGNMGGVIKTVAELADSLRYGPEVPAAARFASSLKVVVDPPVWPMEGPLAIRVVPLYSAEPADGLVLRIVGPGGFVHSREPITAAPMESKFDPRTVAGGGEAACRVEIGRGNETFFAARLSIVARPLGEARAALLEQLKAVEAATPELEQALAACRARINLLQDQPSTTDPAQFLADPIALRGELEREVAAIRAGSDPYRRRTGDHWRPIKAAGLEVPCRIYAPAAAAGDEPRPLLIALHGAGGDESMFFEGYGAGLIKTLADRHGFIVIAPLTYLTMGNGAVFDGLIAAAGMAYAIDPGRIYVMGHSMGAGATAGLVNQRPDRIAAAVCLAGAGRFPAKAKVPPVLLIAGEFDPLIPASRIRPGADAAAKAGQPVEFRLAEGYGHTLLVGAKLEEAVIWLLQHRK